VTDAAERLTRARRQVGDRKARLVVAAVEAVGRRGQIPNVSEVAREAGVGRKFIYDHTDLRALIELRALEAVGAQEQRIIGAARVSAASLRSDLMNAQAQNHRLRKQLQAMEARLSVLEGARVAAEALPGPLGVNVVDGLATEQINELEGQVFQLTENLNRITDELQAARRINRELMQQANRSDHSPGSGELLD
jgi:Family of unknown function (DUF6262)